MAGYVYAFALTERNWMKIGMTNGSDIWSCYSRLYQYLINYGLPLYSWQLVDATSHPNPSQLETQLHRKLKKSRIKIGAATELFNCTAKEYLDLLHYIITNPIEIIDKREEEYIRLYHRWRKAQENVTEALFRGTETIEAMNEFIMLEQVAKHAYDGAMHRRKWRKGKP